MGKLTTLARAPANIALVKYMGKKEGFPNLPENPSISITLESLCTCAEITRDPSAPTSFQWVPEAPKFAKSKLDLLPLQTPPLKEAAIERVRRHVERVMESAPAILAKGGIPVDSESAGSITLRSANTFPMSSGIASSASSFAAITLATAMSFARNQDAFSKAWAENLELRRDLAQLSRRGSGSSCRSFEGPWVLWEGEETGPITSSLTPMAHFVLVVSKEEKSVSSSEAHQRVKSSPLWEGRVARASRRAQRLLQALEAGELPPIARTAWSEAWEMHSLFHTSTEPFTYWQPRTVEILHWLGELLHEPVPPIVTLDAGPNVHVLVPTSLASAWRSRLEAQFPGLLILQDHEGSGAQPLRNPS